MDPDATLLSLHKDQVDKLGLRSLRKVKVPTANGASARNVYGVIRVEIRGREGGFDVLEVPAEMPVLVGYIVLEVLDFVVDSSNQKLIPNPAHGGEYAIDMY